MMFITVINYILNIITVHGFFQHHYEVFPYTLLSYIHFA